MSLLKFVDNNFVLKSSISTSTEDVSENTIPSMKLLNEIIKAQATTIDSQKETIEAQDNKISELESKINFEIVDT